MPGVIDNHDLALRSGATGQEPVALEFHGVFSSGPHRGSLFAGSIRYPADRPASQAHHGFSEFDDWAAPVMTVVVPGRTIGAVSASVYTGLPDGVGGAVDLMTLFGSEERDGSGASVEAMFAIESGSLANVRRMPSAAQLRAMTVKRLSFAAAAGDTPSSGEFDFGTSN